MSGDDELYDWFIMVGICWCFIHLGRDVSGCATTLVKFQEYTTKQKQKDKGSTPLQKLDQEIPLSLWPLILAKESLRNGAFHNKDASFHPPYVFIGSRRKRKYKTIFSKSKFGFVFDIDHTVTACGPGEMMFAIHSGIAK
jgi:hypothetical protein